MQYRLIFLSKITILQLINASPFLLLLGILLAFQFAFAPAFWLILLALPAIAYWFRIKLANWLWVIAALWIMLLGGVRAGDYIANHQVITLSKPYRFIELQAKVEAVEAVSLGKYRLLLSDSRSDKFAPDDSGVRLRLVVRSKIAPQMGDVVRMKANIFAPSRPAIKGGADFARYFYSKNIGGVGYGMGSAEIIKHAGKNNAWLARNILQPISKVRTAIDATLVKEIPAPQAGIAIALITGGRAAIPREVNRAMQVSGITHILSISGLHMSMVCGLLYFMVRFGLACIPMLALHLPIKQYAAIFGLLSGGIYLAIADFPIPAIRAYSMIALLFLGVIFRREADALRSLVLAAIGLLLYNPLNALDVGFQLSFMATYALIVAYRRLVRINVHMRYHNWGLVRRCGIYVGNIALSSVVVGLATAPLVLFHFGIFSSYSVLTNMIALPILSFAVMPSLILGLFTEMLHSGLGAMMFEFANYGLQSLIAAAVWVEGLPQSSLRLPQLPIFSLCLMMLAVMLWLHMNNWRIMVIDSSIILGVAFLWVSPPISPDIMVAEDASAIAVKVAPEKWLLLRGSSGNFFVKQWQNVTGGKYLSYSVAKKMGELNGFSCDVKLGCDGEIAGQNIRTRYDYLNSGALCLLDTEISIASFYGRKMHRQLQCAGAKLKIERDALERNGSQIISFNDEGQALIWHSCLNNENVTWLRCKP